MLGEIFAIILTFCPIEKNENDCVIVGTIVDSTDVCDQESRPNQIKLALMAQLANPDSNTLDYKGFICVAFELHSDI